MIWQMNKFSLVNGESEQIMVHMLDSLSNPLPVSGASAVVLRLRNADATVLEKSPINGMEFGFCNPMYVYVFTFTADEIAALPVGPDQTVFMKIVFGAYHKTYGLKKALTVLAAAM